MYFSTYIFRKDIMDKEQLAEEIRSRIEKSLSRFDFAGKEYDVSLGMRNNHRTIVVKKNQGAVISHYAVKDIEAVLKDYRLSPVFYYIEIDKEEMKPTIEIFVV